jgi:hypothetical protein
MTPERFARFDQALSTESHRPHNTGARKESNEERRPWPLPGRNSGMKRAQFGEEQIITILKQAEGAVDREPISKATSTRSSKMAG